LTEPPHQIFLLDSNTLIEAHRRYYSFDLCPGFWECLTHYCGKARLLSIDRVRGEITGGDELHEWVRKAPASFFVSTADLEVLATYAQIMESVRHDPTYSEQAIERFARGADGWLVAHAHVFGYTVVTLEKYEPESKKSVKIPNICREFDVPYTDTFVMLRSLEVQFAWPA